MKHVLILLLSVSLFAACKSGNDGKSWPAKDKNDFITSCEREATNGGLEKAQAVSYCNCMQVKMEKLYPKIKDAAKVTAAELQTPAMQEMIKDCLGK